MGRIPPVNPIANIGSFISMRSMSWLNRLAVTPLSVFWKKLYGAFKVAFKRSECNAWAVLFMIPMMSRLSSSFSARYLYNFELGILTSNQGCKSLHSKRQERRKRPNNILGLNLAVYHSLQTTTESKSLEHIRLISFVNRRDIWLTDEVTEESTD